MDQPNVSKHASLTTIIKQKQYGQKYQKNKTLHKNVSSKDQWVTSTLKYVDWIFWLLSVTAIVWERE